MFMLATIFITLKAFDTKVLVFLLVEIAVWKRHEIGPLLRLTNRKS